MEFGGGVTFVKNIKQGMPDVDFVNEITMCDIMFVANPMMAERQDFEMAKDYKKPILLRLDNIPEDWNNRGTAISKLRDFTKWADKKVYQSEWSRQKYFEFGATGGVVIPNGVDTSVFKPDGNRMSDIDHPVITFVKSSRNENKRFPEALEMMRRWWAKERRGSFILQGIYDEDKRQYGFGFYNGEPYQFIPATSSLEVMAMIYRSSDLVLFPAFADCMPNVVLESMACGTPVLGNPYGGTGELPIEAINYGDLVGSMKSAMSKSREQVAKYISRYHTLEKMCNEYRKEFECLLTTDSN